MSSTASSTISKNHHPTAAATTTSSSTQPAPLTKANSTASSASNIATIANNAGVAPTTEQMTHQLLAACDWKDKTIWVARQLLGGNATNGFLRSTASVQRIKRQRARQTAQSKAKASQGGPGETNNNASSSNSRDQNSKGAPTTGAAGAANTKDAGKDANNAKGDGKDTKDGKDAKNADNKKRDTPDQEAEEILKKEIMNPRTAKKLKAELQEGLKFCVTLQNAIRSIIMDMDPSIAKYCPLPLQQGGEIPIPQSQGKQPMMAAALPTAAPVTSKPPAAAAPAVTSSAPAAAASKPMVKAPAPAAQPPPNPPEPKQKQKKKKTLEQSQSPDAATSSNKKKEKDTTTQPSTTQASPGGPEGSTLRRNRKKKLPPNAEPAIALAEFDPSGKRLVSKKEHIFRVFEAIRFRGLKEGDFVAARVSSRDLWILALVQKNYPGFSMTPNDFLKLSEKQRDAYFREKVAIKDVEDKDGGIQMVPRSLILPLPRTFSEAAEWCHRYVLNYAGAH